MRMKTANVMFGLSLTVVFALAGCGGGGSDSSFDGGSYYKGNTTQATVTEANAKALSLGVIDSVQDSSFAGGLGKRVTATPGTFPQMLQIATSIESNIQVKSSAAKTVADVVHHTENGYSGSFTISGEPNSNGDVSGTITFDSYKEYSYSPTITGPATYRASVNITTGDLKSLHISLSDVTGEDGSRSYTLNGIMDLKRNDSQTATLDLSIVLLDHTVNKTYWMKDCRIVVTGNTTDISGTYTMNLSGTYYDHDLGYVVISTATPVTVESSTGTFTAGQLLFDGRDRTKARLTYAPAYPGYTVEFFDTVNNVYVFVP
ncbi:MAG: hypothetical protein H6Q56_982 [Deltaproteobacteria bacterium]|nr:hypothetical protein [Deltaproteobacteria bacterium]